MRKTILFTLIPISLSFLLYCKYINAPFGTYDIWFERIVFGDYEFSELPESLKSLDIPTDIRSYIKYRAQYVGRTPGSVFITYLGFSVFGDNPAAWRIFQFILMFFTYYFIYLILRKLRFKDYIIILILILFPAVSSMYFVTTIYLIYVISHLFFLIGLYLELNNSSDNTFKYWKSILGALLIFLSIFIRELQASAALGLFLILIFWYNHNNEQIKFKINYRRLSPYLISAVLYLAIFYGIINHYGKYEFAYANAVSFNMDLQYFKNSLLFILKYVGFSVSAYLGFLLVAVIFAWFIYLKFGTKNNCIRLADYEIFNILFGFSIIIPSGFLISLLTHSTGGFTIHILASLILFATLMQYFINQVSSSLPKIFFILFFMLFNIVRLMEAKQESHNYISQANVIQKISGILLQNTSNNEVVQLTNFTLDEAYSLATEVFLNGRKLEFYSDNIGMKKNPYMNYVQSGMINYKNLIPTIRIIKTNNLNYDSSKSCWIIQEDQKRYSLGKIIINKVKNIDNISPVLNYIHKTLFGYSFVSGINNLNIAVYHIQK